MAPLRIEDLEIQPWIEEKLWPRRIGLADLQDVCFGEHHAERTRGGLYLVLGQTAGGRYLAVVLAPLGGGLWRVVSARDMNDAERRRYRRR